MEDRDDDGTAELVRRIGIGDARAEEELVERFSRGLTLMLRRLAGDPTLAEDLHQETFRLVIEKARRGEIREPEKLAGFLRGTARNLLIATRRKAARYTLEGDDEALAEAAAAPPSEPAPLRQALRREEARLVRRLLGELRFPRDRQILVRFYLGDDSKEEICADLDVEPVRFKKVLHRARGRLRELWERTEKRQQLSMEAG